MRKRAILTALLLWALGAPRTLAAEPGDLLVPMGLAVGIQADCDGVLVSALAEVETPEGARSPAGEAGIRPGDRIVAIGGESVHSGAEFLEKVGAITGQPVELLCVRAGKSVRATVSPLRGQSGNWQLGLWLRPGIRGVGTLTFWDPATGEFGALGHGISLPESGELFPMHSGVITAAVISEVNPGRPGQPGELCAVSEPDAVLGILIKNTAQGVFGDASGTLGSRDALPVAGDGEIRLGAATILSTVDEAGPREFRAEITRITRSVGGERQLTLSVTDPELLARTGGIVQGMSGSPILQGGKLVGAVTHVSVPA